MAVSETQATLRRCFERYGLPRQIRVDNGTPWRSKGDLPTDLELWLAALGVGVVANTPRRPQENGVVERSQGTGKRWAEPATAVSAAELQERIDAMDRRQRESYPDGTGRSRWETHPELIHSGRPYLASGEAEQLVLKRAEDRLADFVVPRRVDRGGAVSIDGRNQYVGKAYADRLAFVRFDPQERYWLFQDEAGHQWNRHAVRELCLENVQSLRVTNRRDRTASSKPNQEKLADTIDLDKLDVA